jgi:hypothetical protein
VFLISFVFVVLRKMGSLPSKLKKYIYEMTNSIKKDTYYEIPLVDT